ncbi:hypothetical protein M513_10698 [Trichuris suis]|uniref:BED-type domain-containing protein n=1 Tax=Trichuris suis TaxID=68888 RepID=A0A085LU34_9BILA|nr:hypothetical protein M513_10698 [Trichuris suis]
MSSVFLGSQQALVVQSTYLEYGFVTAPHDHLLPLCLTCKATFSNENTKPCKMKKHLISVHSEKKDKHN